MAFTKKEFEELEKVAELSKTLSEITIPEMQIPISEITLTGTGTTRIIKDEQYVVRMREKLLGAGLE